MARRITPQELHDSHRWFQLDELEFLPGNPNVGDEESLSSSIDEFGWFDGIVVHKGKVVAGNHRVEQARARGEDGLPGYDLSAFRLSTVERMAMALAHNHTTRAGANDPERLLAAIEPMPAKLREVGGVAGIDVVTMPGPTVEGGPAAPEPVTVAEFDHECPRCHFRY